MDISRVAGKIPKLEIRSNKSNWETWKIQMNSLLIALNLRDVLVKDPSTIPTMLVDIVEEGSTFIDRLNEYNHELADYITKCQQCISAIRLNLGETALIQTKLETNPYNLQNKLESLFELKGFSSDFNIIKEFFSTKLDKLTNIDAYITKITTIASDLEARGIKLLD